MARAIVPVPLCHTKLGAQAQRLQVEAETVAEIPLWLSTALAGKALGDLQRPLFLNDKCVAFASQRLFFHGRGDDAGQSTAVTRHKVARALQDAAQAHCRRRVREPTSPVPVFFHRRQAVLWAVRSRSSRHCVWVSWQAADAPPCAQSQGAARRLHATCCSSPRRSQRGVAAATCRLRDTDADAANVVFTAYKERYHTVAGCALGQDRTFQVDDFTQKLSHEELLRAHPLTARRRDSARPAACRRL